MCIIVACTNVYICNLCKHISQCLYNCTNILITFTPCKQVYNVHYDCSYFNTEPLTVFIVNNQNGENVLLNSTFPTISEVLNL